MRETFGMEPRFFLQNLGIVPEVVKMQNSNLFPHASHFISNRFKDPNPSLSITLSLPSLTRVIVPMIESVCDLLYRHSSNQK